jgi:hypothetical protein
MVRHKVNSKNFQSFKSFTGMPYYNAYYLKKAFKVGIVNRTLYNKENFMWTPFWIDNYKRLNALHNKLRHKIKELNIEMDKVKEPIFSFKKDTYSYAMCYKQTVYCFTINPVLKEFSFSTDSVSYFCKDDLSKFVINHGYNYIQTNTKELNKILTQWVKLNKIRNKYRDYLAKVEHCFSEVLRNIIIFENNKTKQIMSQREFNKTVIINVDGDEIVANINRAYHASLDHLTISFDFSKNIARVSL